MVSDNLFPVGGRATHTYLCPCSLIIFGILQHCWRLLQLEAVMAQPGTKTWFQLSIGTLLSIMFSSVAFYLGILRAFDVFGRRSSCGHSIRFGAKRSIGKACFCWQDRQPSLSGAYPPLVLLNTDLALWIFPPILCIIVRRSRLPCQRRFRNGEENNRLPVSDARVAAPQSTARERNICPECNHEFNGSPMPEAAPATAVSAKPTAKDGGDKPEVNKAQAVRDDPDGESCGRAVNGRCGIEKGKAST